MKLFLIIVGVYILAVAAVISPEDRCPEVDTRIFAGQMMGGTIR